MADIDLKTETPDATLPSTGFLFGADSQAAASPSVYSTQAVATALLGSTSLTGATVTTSQPLLDLSQTWNDSGVTFTGLRFNVPTDSSAAGSLLMDLQVGGSSKFAVRKDNKFGINGLSWIQQSNSAHIFLGQNASTVLGRVNSSGFMVPPTSFIGFGDSTPDVLLTRRGAANLRFGAADTGSNTATVTITIATPGVVTWTGHGLSTGTPVFFTTTGALPTGITASTTYYVIAVDANTFQIATTAANAYAGTAVNTSGSQSGTQTGNRNAITQRLSVQSVTGVTNRPGSDLVITGSQGTGTGAGGSIVFQVAPAGGAGSTPNAFQTVLQITGAGGLTGQDGATANTLALRNSTNAQTFRVYNTFTDASNYERGFVQFGGVTANAFELGTANAGTGSSRPMHFVIGGAVRSGVDTSGHTFIVTGRSLFFGGTTSGAGVSLTQSSNNLVLAGGNITITFGGTTSSFPSLKRSSTTLQVRLADDTANAPLESASVKTDAPAGGTSGTWKLGIAATVSPTSPNRTIEVDIGGTIYYIAAKTTND